MIAKRDEQLFVLEFLSVTVSAIVKLYTSMSVSLCIKNTSNLKLVQKKLVKKKNAAHFWPISPVNVWDGSLSMF